MRSVRLRLLILAFAPMVLLLPLLLLLGMTRWTADYDKVLIANVESDLKIAEQYLSRLLTGTAGDLEAVAGSAAFRDVVETGDLAAYLEGQRRALSLDFLYFLPRADATEEATQWPVIAAGLGGTSTALIDIFAPEILEARHPDLAARARIDLIETEAAVPTQRRVEDRGMVVHAASPVTLPGLDGVLIAGVLLNRNLGFIDAINELVYLNAVTGGDRQGTATLFLEDVRVSTNVRLFEDVRALGTRVSAAVRGAVLGQGETWLDRAFVVNDWYISGYLPLTDSFGERVGMLYVGFLEAPFVTAKNTAYVWMLAAFVVVLAISLPVFLWMAKGIFAPLERMTQTMRQVGTGDLSARNGQGNARDEIGQVAAHLDDLLDQVQDRDRRLRAWADELNDRVAQRTTELSAANEKLEETYKQLVLSEKLASIGEITAGVAHEINNPTAVIQGNVDVMRETLGAKADTVATELTLIDQQVGRIRAIIGKLLQFARPGEFADAGDPVALSPLVEDCLVLVAHSVETRGITINTNLQPVADVRIDRGEMQQVVINLIVNAVHAMGGAGQLDLTLEPARRAGQAGVSLTVSDTGPGIAEGRVESVFDPFFTTKQAEGTGLGLSISQTLIQKAGGMITASNRDGQGAAFQVWLPVVQTVRAA